MKILPLSNYILILPEDKIGKTKDGFLIPDSEQEMSYKAKVVAVGEGKIEDGKLILPKVKAGDIVLHKSYGLTGVKIDGEDHFIVEEQHLLGIVEE